MSRNRHISCSRLSFFTCKSKSIQNPRILPCWEQHNVKYVRSKTYSNSITDGGYIMGLKIVIWMPTIPLVSHFFCFHNDWFQYWKMYLGFTGCLPYETCLIIPLQTLMMERKCLLNTNTSAAMRQESAYHVFRTSVMAVKNTQFLRCIHTTTILRQSLMTLP
jgi:hypothetical protein